MTTAEHDSALGRWTYVWQRPSEPLRGLIDGYTGYHQRMAVPATHRGLPTATLPLVIDLGPRMTIDLPGSGRPPAVVGSFVAGLHDRYVLIDAQDHHGIQVDLQPMAAYRLLGRPLAELTTQIVDLDDVFGPEAARLVDDLAGARTWQDRFRRLDRELVTRLLAPDRHLDAEVAHAFDLIRASRGTIRVTQLARATGWSTRRLSGRFGRQLGLAPKRMARLTRFEHTMQLLSDPSTPDLATAAALAGFADQAHLTNDVRHYTGLSPTKLLATRLPDAGSHFDLHAA